MRAGSLRIGATLLELGGEQPLGVVPRRIHTLSAEPGSVVTYNLEIAEHHRYFANGVLVDDRT